jgi:hypothetical protein
MAFGLNTWLQRRSPISALITHTALCLADSGGLSILSQS